MEDSEQSGVKPDLNNKRHWHEHVSFFSHKSLECLFKRSRLEIVSHTRFKENAWGNWNFFQAFILKKVILP